MPETPKTTLRIQPDLRDKAKAKAAAEGTTMTAVVIAALTDYVEDK
jgi:predicted HicB family RNase H-like nuclease